MAASSVFFSNQLLLVLFMLVIPSLIMVAAAAGDGDGDGDGGGGGCIQSIFNFGDDISDTGNYIFFNPPSSNLDSDSSSIYNFTDVNVHHDLPYDGITTYLNKLSGRASNGRLVIDFVADALGLPFLPPYPAGLQLAPPTHDHLNYSKGANFAVIGANAMDHNSINNNNNKKTSLRLQFDWFEDLLTSLCSSTTTTTTTTTTIDDSCTQRYLKNSLFHIGGIGTYDYRLYNNITELETMVAEMVAGITYLVDKLSFLGAENFMVAGLLPIGCFPVSTQNYAWHEIDDENGCVFELDRIARHHNTLLQRELQFMRDWSPEANIIYAEYYKAAAAFINSPTEYGFTNSKEACVSEATGNTKKCEKPDTYVFWDQSHMTEAAYRIIASSAIAGKSTTPSFSLLSSKC